jgi:hypothetical protein
VKSSRIVRSRVGIAAAEAIEHQTHVSPTRRIADTKLICLGSTPKSSARSFHLQPDQVVGEQDIDHLTG